MVISLNKRKIIKFRLWKRKLEKLEFGVDSLVRWGLYSATTRAAAPAAAV
ncbi:hypothetical protein BMNI_I1576 [Brucella melitensis NI]|nr:hypothetical protein BMNI_I1576 [Brucella melitensis NI]